ncbi:MAG: DUF928 domain-containing protein [Leptolyngbya sp. SIO4C5]|nr:DUF928 domain-containing protein [Leptolyngbya sp. SIO4C5]
MRRSIWHPVLLTLTLLAGSLPLSATAEAAGIRPGLGTIGENHQEVLLAGYRRFRFRVRTSRYRSGGFRRGPECFVDPNDRLAVIAPPAKPEEEVAAFDEALDARTDNADNVGPIDKTASAHPVFLAYIPQLRNATEAQLTVQTSDFMNQIADIPFEVSSEGGIVAIQVPSNTPGLEVGSQYIWQLAVQCNTADNSRSDDLAIESWIEREAIAASAPSTPQERVAFYAEQGIWQETASTLAQLRHQFPDDAAISRDWAALMADVGLDQYASVPVVQVVR